MVAHSQGGLVTSLALDMLFADLADEVLSRLEIYTFGNAANHFNNPPNTYAPDNGRRIRFPTIKHIEHYANEFDFVSRLGVLAYYPGPRRPMVARARVSPCLFPSALTAGGGGGALPGAPAGRRSRRRSRRRNFGLTAVSGCLWMND